MSDSVYIHQKMLEDHTNTSKQECIQQQLLQETNISLPTWGQATQGKLHTKNLFPRIFSYNVVKIHYTGTY